MKKRSLILSTALLLVAILACTSATYAWFTQNTDAKVTNISANVAAASSLLISNADTAPNPGSDAWKTSVSYADEDFTLTDLSSLDGTTGSFFSRNVNNDVITYVGNANGYIELKLHFISTSDGDLTISAATFDTDGTDTSLVEKAARIAFLNDNGTTSYFVWEPDATSGAVNNDGYKTTAVDAVTAFDQGQLTTEEQTTVDGALNNQKVTELAANTAKTVLVRIWLEGQDAQCANYITGNDISAAFTFNCVANG